VAAGHTMQVKEKHYEKVGEDFEQVHETGVYKISSKSNSSAK
jgi:hypothetical protein